MRNIGQSVKFIIIAVVLGLIPGIASQAAAKPLKVFILAGQSNMEGRHTSGPSKASRTIQPRRTCTRR